MSQTDAASAKPMITSNGGSGRRRLLKMRLGAPIAAVMGGAGVLLSQLFALASSFG